LALVHGQLYGLSIAEGVAIAILVRLRPSQLRGGGLLDNALWFDGNEPASLANRLSDLLTVIGFDLGVLFLFHNPLLAFFPRCLVTRKSAGYKVFFVGSTTSDEERGQDEKQRGLGHGALRMGR
jgi:hypothetical protein